MANLTVEEDGGGDYTTLDEACDNIGSTETITIQGAWDNPDTRAVIVSTDCSITATGTARISTSKHVAGVPLHYRLHVADGNHCVTVNDSPTTIDGIEIKQNADGNSDECIRFAHNNGTLTVKNLILWSTDVGNDQDGVYFGTISCTINAENCIGYSLKRAVLHSQVTGAGVRTQTLNINSCIGYNCGRVAAAISGIVSIDMQIADLTANINVHNTFAIDCDRGAGDDYNEYIGSGDNATVTWGISYSIDSDNSIAARDGGGAGNQASRAIADSDQGAGSYVIVNDITGAAPFDLSLLSLGNAKNNAEDEHAAETAETLSIPGTDIDGTVRPVNTNYDVGAFEIAAGGPTAKAVAGSLAMAGALARKATFKRAITGVL